ncbi:MAG: hypothetical protein ACRD68_04150, partial [Pyrinomonadaceae bacterium]
MRTSKTLRLKSFGAFVVDFIITKGIPESGGFGEIDLTTRPYKITLDPRNANIDVKSVAARIAHELGHRIGLSNAVSSCGLQSIMSDGTTSETGVRASINITANDVRASNRNFDPNTRGQCTSLGGTGRTGEACQDNDNDGFNTCNGDQNDADPNVTCIDSDADGICGTRDCDDFNPSVAFDADGDGYCYPDDCNDYDPNTYPGADICNTEGGADRNCSGID